MKCAPACRFFVGHSRVKLYFLAVAWLLGALICVVWWSLSVRGDWRGVLVLVAVFLAFGVASRAANQSTQGQLRWDGKVWWFEPSPPNLATTSEGQCTPVVHFDFQFFMLLSLRVDGAKEIWLWADRANERKRWHALRCALYAAAPAQDKIAAPKITRPPRRLSL